MQIIDAYWEQRNLGTTCKEVILEPSDSIDALQMFIQDAGNVGYMVLKVPAGGVKFLQFLSGHGFIFIESLNEVTLNLSGYKMSPKIERFDKNINYRRLPFDELDRLGAEIKKGIFNTDRIALDGHFGVDIAANRYFNWIKDEVAIGNSVYETSCKATPLGFFALKQTKKGVFDIFLAGMYLNPANFGFGFSILSKSIEEVKRQGGEFITTHISSNNIRVFRLYLQFGFVLDKISYVMIKHY